MIDKDLPRWPRGKWIAVVFLVFALQVAFMIAASQKQVHVRHVYPSEPRVALATSVQPNERELLELENPFLFAGASRNGFSGDAWLRKPGWTAPIPSTNTDSHFLRLAEARNLAIQHSVEQPFSFVEGRRPRAQLPLPEVTSAPISQTSELKLSDFKNRHLANTLTLPVQFHSDVLKNSVVETMIDRDGLVISARLIGSSGSPRADAEALALAGRARFSPLSSGESLPEVGKLIFQWFTLHLSDTNNVKR